MGRIHNIEGKKNKMDSLRSTAFTKHARNITVAARQGGGDPAYNAALKLAIDKAKADNMPNDNINRAIKKGIGATDGEKYEHITYEGYGPGGVALIIECLTDNKNRTAGNVRHHLDRCGGNLGTDGCVSFMFERKGAIAIEKEACPMSEDELMELVLEAGAEDFAIEDSHYEIITAPEDYVTVRDAIDGANIPVLSGDITMLPSNYTEVPADKAKSMQKLLDALEEDDDVQNVYSNMAQ
mgnify:FL=1